LTNVAAITRRLTERTDSEQKRQNQAGDRACLQFPSKTSRKREKQSAQSDTQTLPRRFHHSWRAKRRHQAPELTLVSPSMWISRKLISVAPHEIHHQPDQSDKDQQRRKRQQQPHLARKHHARPMH